MKIIMATCYGYRDCWLPFARLMEIFWPSRPYACVIASDTGKEFFDQEVNPKLQQQGSFQFYQTGKDISWCKNLLDAIDHTAAQSDEPILLMQEDFLMSGPVNEKIIEEAIERLKDRNVSMVRIMPCPGPDAAHDQYFGLINENAPYRVSCQATIWRQDALRRLLTANESPVDFELRGTASKPPGAHLSVYREQPFPFPYYVTAIVRGKWQKGAIKLCEENGVPIDVSKRAIDAES